MPQGWEPVQEASNSGWTPVDESANAPAPPGPGQTPMQKVDLATGQPSTPADEFGAGVLKSGAGMVGGIASLLDRVIPQGKDTTRGQDIKDIQEFSQASGPGEAIGKVGGDIASMFAPGGLQSRLGRILGAGAVSGAQGGTPADIALGAGSAGAGEAIQAGVKALRTSIKGIKDPQLKNLANAFRDALDNIKVPKDERSGIEARDVVRRSGDTGRSEQADTALNEQRMRGQRSGVDVDRRSNFDRRQTEQPSSIAEQAVANVEQVWNKTPDAVKNKPGARDIYNQVMSHVGGGRQEMPQSLESKYDMVKRIMDHRALYHAALGAAAGGLYGERGGDPITGAMKGAAIGASPSLAVRGLPALGKAAPALMRPLPPLYRATFGGSQQQ